MRSVGKLEKDAVSEAMDILDDARGEIAERLISATGFEPHRLRELQASTDQVLAEMTDRYKEFFDRKTLESWNIGSRLALDPVEQTLGINISSVGPSREILEVLQGTTADLVTDVTNRTRSTINREIRNTTIGLTRPFEAQQEIMKALSTRRREGIRVGIAAQAEAIIETELPRIHTVAQFEEMRRIKDIVPDAKKQWIQVSPPNRRRETHRQLHERVIPMGQRFKFTGRGGKKVALMFPRDPSGPAEEVIRCFLPGTKVEGLFTGGSKARYSGPARQLKTSRGYSLSVTVNHPVLTDNGWLPARSLKKGDCLLSNTLDIGLPMLLNVNNQNGPIPIEDVFNSLATNGTRRLEVIRGLDFHGDSEFFTDDVHVIDSDRILLKDVESQGGQIHSDPVFMESFSNLIPEYGASSLDFLGLSMFSGSSDFPCFREQFFDFGSIMPDYIPPQFSSVGRSAYQNAPFAESPDKSVATDAELFSQLKHALAGLIAIDHIIEIRDFYFSGHVYNLQSSTGWIISDGICTGNCNCRLLTFRDDWTIPPEPKGVLDL